MDTKLMARVGKHEYRCNKDFMVSENRETKNRAIRAQDEVKQMRELCNKIDERYVSMEKFEQLEQKVQELEEEVKELADFADEDGTDY